MKTTLWGFLFRKKALIARLRAGRGLPFRQLNRTLTGYIYTKKTCLFL